MVGMSPVNLHGLYQHSRGTSTKQKLDKVVDMYKSTIAEAYDVSKDVLDTSDFVFEESDAQWKAAELKQLHDAMREKLKTALYPEKILDTDTDPQQVVTRVCIILIIIL